MRFDKPALRLIDQVSLLQSRGLHVADPERAGRYLDSIGYYRLSAYCLTFEVPSPDGQPRAHHFTPGASFESVLALYVFDRKLRLLVIEAIERVEVAARTRWAYAMSTRHGAHAHMDATLFKDPWDHTKHLATLAKDLQASKETFVQHYREKYATPFMPPIWAVVETMTLGALSHWLQNTKDNAAKKEIADAMGLPNVEVLESVLHTLTPIRNACAHHSRLWNRRLPMKLPHIKRYRQDLIPPESPNHQAHHMYNPLTMLAVLLKRMNPGTTWARRVVALIESELPPGLLRQMGFPADWRQRPVWCAEWVAEGSEPPPPKPSAQEAA